MAALRDKVNNQLFVGPISTMEHQSIEPVVVRVQSYVLTNKLHALSCILEMMKLNEDAVYFNAPVAVRDFPSGIDGFMEYRAVIKMPMDLSTVRERLSRRLYTCSNACLADVHHMFVNCFTYNSKKSETARAGKRLQRSFLKMVRDLMPSGAEVPFEAGWIGPNRRAFTENNPRTLVMVDDEATVDIATLVDKATMVDEETMVDRVTMVDKATMVDEDAIVEREKKVGLKTMVMIESMVNNETTVGRATMVDLEAYCKEWKMTKKKMTDKITMLEEELHSLRAKLKQRTCELKEKTDEMETRLREKDVDAEKLHEQIRAANVEMRNTLLEQKLEHSAALDEKNEINSDLERNLKIKEQKVSELLTKLMLQRSAFTELQKTHYEYVKQMAPVVPRKKPRNNRPSFLVPASRNLKVTRLAPRPGARRELRPSARDIPSDASEVAVFRRPMDLSHEIPLSPILGRATARDCVRPNQMLPRAQTRRANCRYPKKRAYQYEIRENTEISSSSESEPASPMSFRQNKYQGKNKRRRCRW